MNWKAKIIIAVGLIIGFYSCRPDDDLSDTPFLESRDVLLFRSVEGLDSAIWTVDFTDGDGDLGIEGELNSSSPDNFIGTAFQIKNGQEIKLPNTPNYKIPTIPDVNTSRGLRGKFEFTIEIRRAYANRGFDTIRIEGYALDRANNRSNVVSTPLIPLN